MRLLELTQKYAAAVVVVLAVAVLAAVAGAGGGPSINAAFGYIVAAMDAVLYFKIPLPFLREMPLVVAVLFFGAVFFTFRFRFINFRAFKHGIDVLLGRFDDPDDPGDVSHFQALSSALSATVGLGNIAGVAIAVSLGGPGAVFWMMVVALFGMSSKFAECTLGQIYRQTDTAGEMRGGPMVYLREGLRDRKLGPFPLGSFGVALSVLFAVLCIGTAIGAGNMFQTNQSFQALSDRIQWLGGRPAEGEVTLESDRPWTIDAPAHQIHFVAPSRESDDGPVAFRTPSEIELDSQDWSAADGGSKATWTFRSSGREIAGILELRTDSGEGFSAESLASVIERVRPAGGDSAVDLSTVHIDEEDWTQVERIENPPTEWAEALELQLETRAWDEAQKWKYQLPVARNDGPETRLVLRAAEPLAIDDVRAAVERVAPPVEDLSETDLAAFKPADERLVLERSDWKSTGDGYEANLPVRSIASGERFNLREGAITRVVDARLDAKQRNIRDWLVVPDLRADNPEATAAGTDPRGWAYGLLLLLFVGLVIIGGIKSIARVAEKIVPLMCAFYIVAGLCVIYLNFEHFGLAARTIFREAFRLEAGWGVFVGIFVQGVRRAAFSSEAGIGSAPIAHSAAKTDEPVREGVVAMLGPFIDTIIVCFITGMVIVISGVWATPSTAGLEGVTLTVAAFKSATPIFAWALSIAVVLFAFSTMLSWSYYGERCWTYLFGDAQAMPFRFIFLFFVMLGAVSNLENVLSFGDYFLLAMAFPNIIGVVLLSDEIDEHLRDYWERYQEGEFSMEDD